MKNLRFIFVLLKMKFSRMMVFRFDFFGGFFVDSSLFILQLLMFEAIYSNTDSIGSFQRGDMIIFIGTFSLINAINMTIFFFGTYDIPRKIRDGELDYYITKPVNPLFRMTFENINPGSFPLIIVSGFIIFYGILVLDLNVSVAGIVIYMIWVLMMTLLWYDISIILRTVSFFTISSTVTEQLEENFLSLNMKLLGVAYKGIFRVLFYFVLPYGIMATFPTQYLTGTLSWMGMIYGAVLICGFTLFMLWFWKAGLRNYKSASS
ncbi:ABC transporter permease [Sebaldella sp. S0638]|uniref:ABC transporter permease n=1 Tax=Sebaldella sp. S0638 TaxID=2957809 RepID=UPI0020A11DBB|nr:ABC-2 family transporter protein [Sebaldella sp. S0638]MCP1225300.1 ABC transporter permease [Sebaldella sp. S0638]